MGTSCEPAEPDCTATVGEVETCLQDSREAVDKFLRELPTCATITASMTSGDADLDFELQTPASCTELEMKCSGRVRVPPISLRR